MKKSIGIFDSGVGGLTVFKSIREVLPHRNLLYFGDTARVPYGSKSKETIIKYSIQNANFLIQQNIDLLVVACNTSSAFALHALKKEFKIPIIGVIGPGVKKASQVTKNKRIGLIGTEGTIKSKVYEEKLKEYCPQCKIFAKPTPLLVPLVEENWLEHKVTHMVIKEYIESMLAKNIDTLIMGCTHYPVLKKTLRKIVDDKINLIDSAESVAEVISSKFDKEKTEQDGNSKFFVSDNPRKFKKIGESILDFSIKNVKRINFEET
ncbi:MAG: glutamate racemase [Candidatus Cloacimonetes bacterium]|nr:glutamate racemase [Candidatus Cloacimonadota bacterium]MBS3768119.1 glutamate racemase [Candidatus Cloacimonadota bacterium]